LCLPIVVTTVDAKKNDWPKLQEGGLAVKTTAADPLLLLSPVTPVESAVVASETAAAVDVAAVVGMETPRLLAETTAAINSSSEESETVGFSFMNLIFSCKSS